MLTPEVIEVPFLSSLRHVKDPWGEGEERNVGTSITSFSSFPVLSFFGSFGLRVVKVRESPAQRTQRKDRKKSTRLWLVEKEPG